MKRRLAFLAAALLLAAPAQAEKLRLALQKTGTTGWEMAVVKAFGLDKAAGLELEVTELASPEAGKIAIQGGSADIIVSDWLWVARERAQGAKLTLYPYSTGVGAVMTRDASIKSVKDLVGKKLGVAGGPLDKSWLMLEAFALKQGVDLAKSATILYGAPPLIAEKALQGEIDAALEFWNFAADLEGKGFARAIDIVDVEKALGAKGNVVITGYVFDDAFAAKNKDALARFFAMTGKAKALIATDDKAWAVAASRIGQKDAATLDIYRKRYVAGIPKRPIAEEEADAAALYKVLAETGGEKLVGPGKTLAPGTFYKGGEAAAR
ncbi:ABC transporter substrate-binding protein [Methylocystis iwaonis]|uniref:ABC transporter substrate-binding protein n=1 Tax=Methylocystis iwaonis TaxID=2885079 RepID=UPI002E7B593E|nr:ABC transporter substrate-binding protein [Methylocystis iwaonis]